MKHKQKMSSEDENKHRNIFVDKKKINDLVIFFFSYAFFS